jgi:outer membrane protein OmpA-like peptidoglycan-associated protein
MRINSLICKGLIAAVITSVLGGCYTTDAYTGNRQVSTTAKGAGIGALAGAVAGILTGDDSRERRKRALIGAGVGALAGGAVGQYMDRQEAKLRAQLQGTGVSVTRVGNNITLNMPGNITFKTDSADLQPSFFEVLNSVSIVLKEYDKTLLEVAGHTDNTGDDAYNQSLSERRASSVSQYLQSHGINGQRLIAVGGGEGHPVASNDSADGRQLNRRVELTLEPITVS